MIRVPGDPHDFRGGPPPVGMKMVQQAPTMGSYGSGGGASRQAPTSFSGRMGMGGSPIPTSAAFGPPPGARRGNLQGGEAGPYAGAFSRGVGPGATRGSMAAQNAPRHNQMGQMNSGGTDTNAVQQARMQGPDPAAIQAEMKRRQMGASMGPQNAALAGYMMGS